MCGIVYIEDFLGRPVNNGILDQYDKQKTRGQEGFGLFDGQKLNIVRATKENKILKWLVKYDSPLIMFHHRFPTSTANVKRAAHPFSTGGYFDDTRYVMVHNGVIRNSDELFVDHQELGIDYKTLLTDMTYNDSEALMWDFALFIEGRQKEMKAVGDMAFICIKLVKNKLERMYFYTNGARPLNMLRSSEGIMLSSEGEGLPVQMDRLFNWNYKLKRLYSRKLLVRLREPYVPSVKYHSNYPYSSSSGLWDDYDFGYDEFGNWVGSAGIYNYEGYTRNDFAGRDPADDPKAYEEYWMNRSEPAKTRHWLKDVLKDSYNRYFNNDGSFKDVGTAPLIERADKSQVLDYEQNSSGIYIPVADRKLAEKGLIARKRQYPSEAEIQTELLAYLAGVKGHFEQAHWAIECDYEDLENAAQTADVIRQKVLLDLALQQLDNDPEYKNAESVSSIWEAIWAQQLVNAG